MIYNNNNILERRLEQVMGGWTEARPLPRPECIGSWLEAASGQTDSSATFYYATCAGPQIAIPPPPPPTTPTNYCNTSELKCKIPCFSSILLSVFKGRCHQVMKIATNGLPYFGRTGVGDHHQPSYQTHQNPYSLKAIWGKTKSAMIGGTTNQVIKLIMN